MQSLTVVIAVLLAATALSAGALAQNYPWCAYISTGDGNATNCGFVTREQCMATISGMGGHCEPNNTYVPPVPQQGMQSPGAVSTGQPEHR
jgi:hypothetical protein